MMVSSDGGTRSGGVTHAWGLTSSSLAGWLSELRLDPPRDALVEQSGGQKKLRVARIVCGEPDGRVRLFAAGDAAETCVELGPSRSAWAAGDDRGVRSLHLLGADSGGYAVVRFAEPIAGPGR